MHIGLLCVVLLASVVSLAGGGLGASPVLAQGASAGPFARVWAKKLASGNVEFGVAVYATPSVAASPAIVNNRYFSYASASVGTWYNSEPLLLRSGTDSALVAVRARKLASSNLEFALRVYGVDDSYWTPAARYFAYADTSVGSAAYSSAFSLRQRAQVCLGGAVSSPATNVHLFRDCEVLLASKDALEGSTNGLSNWTGSTSISSWTGVSVTSNRMDTLDLRSANLSGTIPASLGKLSALKYLYLDDNDLTGGIPSELGNLSSLEQLYLNNNRLTGGIPSELGNLSSLERLHLHNNDLTRGIPASLGSLTSLKELYLRRNSLSGTVPASLGNLAPANGGSIQAITLHFVGRSLERSRGYQAPGADDNPGLSGCVPSALNAGVITVWRDIDNLPFCS